jgi:hypothetical protein
VTPPAFSPTRIRFEKIEKRYGGLYALRRVSLEIAEDECVALAGRNGSGENYPAANRGQPGAPPSWKYGVPKWPERGEYLCRHPSIRTLLLSACRSVQVGRPRFGKCCYLIIDLGSPWHSPELGG